MLVAALTTGHKIGLGVVALAFIVYALASSFLVPRFRPQFPGKGGVSAFVAATVLVFCGMIAAVYFFGKEKPEGEAKAAAVSVARKVAVSETEFKIKLSTSSLSAGSYEFDLTNDGKLAHNLTVKGPGVGKAATPTIGPGKTATLKVTLAKGAYELYCSVPGHKASGMDLRVSVS